MFYVIWSGVVRGPRSYGFTKGQLLINLATTRARADKGSIIAKRGAIKEVSIVRWCLSDAPVNTRLVGIDL